MKLLYLTVFVCSTAQAQSGSVQQPLIPNPLQRSEDGLPSFNVTFKPVFDTTTLKAESLNITLQFSSPSVAAEESLVELPLIFGNTPSQAYNGTKSLSATDNDGDLTLTISDDEAHNVRRWLASRSTSGDVELTFTALPRHVDINTPVGPRVDLRELEGGLMGAGFSMLPLPVTALDKQYDISFCWDLDGTPDSTTVASPFGEERCTTTVDSLQALQSSIFAVGASLNRYPPIEVSPDYGLFYFGSSDTVPFNIPELGRYVGDLFANMSAFFHDPSLQPYRVFLRQSLRGFGGAGFKDAFMLEYFPTVNITMWELQDLLAHEVTHNWPLMGSSPGTPTRADNTWYNEGIATYYQVFLPYHFGVTSREELVTALNRELQAFNTNPRRHISLLQAAEESWVDPNAQRLPYHRGMVYLIYIDDEIRRHTDSKQGVDDAVLALLDLRREGKAHDLKVWLEIVAQYIGEDLSLKSYERIAVGQWIVPSPSALEYLGLRLQFVKQNELQLGFDSKSLNSRVISGVVPGSRAEGAGIKDGDQLVESGTLFWQVADDITRNMSLTLRRDAEVWEVSYWPRRNVLVNGLEVVEMK